MRHRLKFAGKKCIRMVLLLLGVSLAAFLLMAASPLDPLQTNVGQAALGSMSPCLLYTSILYQRQSGEASAHVDGQSGYNTTRRG